jgi:hypothetical protein
MNPIGWLRVEGAAEAAIACWLYSHTGNSWYLFAILFFAPDLAMLGYLFGPRVGAWCYNILHNYFFAMLLAAWSFTLGHILLFGIALIWCVHIAFDRVLGYGLKSPLSFKSTHLGTLGS